MQFRQADGAVLSLLEDDHIYWFWIGAYAEYDELLQQYDRSSL